MDLRVRSLCLRLSMHTAHGKRVYFYPKETYAKTTKTRLTERPYGHSIYFLCLKTETTMTTSCSTLATVEFTNQWSQILHALLHFKNDKWDKDGSSIAIVFTQWR